MKVLSRLYRGENDFDFRRVWRWGLPISGVAVLISVISLTAQGLNLGIDFEGGGVWEVPTQDLSIAEARDAMATVDLADAKIQTLTNQEGSRVIRVQAGVDAVDRSGEITGLLAETAGVEVAEISASTVGPSWGQNITDKAIRALFFFFLALGAYISLRLEWRMAIGAMAAVVHDIVICVGVYSVFRLEVTPATVVAFLTILGFSLYDTIVVFDKVQDNQARVGLANRTTYTGLMNLSLNQTLMRSVNTTLVTILPVISMLLIGAVLLGAVSLEEFGLALFVGLVSGAYSSVVIAASLVATLKEREPRNRALRERLERAYGGSVPVTGIRHSMVSVPKVGALAASGGATTAAGSTSTPARPTSTPGGTTIPPRPRKKKKR